jgi:pimeloyl-ACP methyl ester carboxylesterase
VPRISLNGVSLNVQTDGDGEAVLLLHGCPDSLWLWRDLAPRLVAAGYKTVALDGRGFGESDASPRTSSYALPILAQDALGVLDTLGVERAHLVGHDWGAAVAWLLAGNHPDRFLSLTALSVGHARAYAAAGLEQLRRAWYILLILVPGLGEWLLRRKEAARRAFTLPLVSAKSRNSTRTRSTAWPSASPMPAFRCTRSSARSCRSSHFWSSCGTSRADVVAAGPPTSVQACARSKVRAKHRAWPTNQRSR